MVTRLYITNDTRNQMPLMCMCKSCDRVLKSGYSLPIGHATQTGNGSPWLASYSQSYYLQIKYYAEIVSSSNRTNNIYCNTAYQLAIYWCDCGVTSLWPKGSHQQQQKSPKVGTLSQPLLTPPYLVKKPVIAFFQFYSFWNQF